MFSLWNETDGEIPELIRVEDLPWEDEELGEDSLADTDVANTAETDSNNQTDSSDPCTFMYL